MSSILNHSARIAIYVPYVVFGYLSLFTLGLLDNARGPFFPDLSTSLELSDSKASFLFVTTSLVSFFIGRAVPFFLKKISLLNLTRLAHLIMGLGFFALAWTYDFKTLVLAAALFGVGFGTINVSQNILILDGSTARTRRRLLSGLHSIYALASLLSPLVVSLLYSNGFDWRTSMMLMSLAPLIALVSSFSCHNQPHVSGSEAAELPARFRFDVILFSIGAGFYVIAELLLSSRLVLFLQRQHGWAPQEASLLLSGFFIAMFISRLFFTFRELKNIQNIQIMKVALCFSAVFFYLAVAFSPYFFVVVGLFMGPIFGVSIDYVSEIFSYASSRAIASVLAIQSLVIVSMHYIIGLITESLGIQVAMLLGPLFIGLSYLFMILEPWNKQKK